MSSWRDTASAQAQADLDDLVNTALGFAQQQLAAKGEFYPYAAAISIDGQTEMVAAPPAPGDDHPLSADVVAACFGALTEKRDAIRAGAVVTDVRTNEGGDAIRVDLEHVDGHALTVLLPYTKGRQVDFGRLRAQPGRRQIWP